MLREIFEVYAKVVDANGAYNTVTGYPKVFDSKNYGNDIEKAKNRALSEYHSALEGMYKADTRQVQFAMILQASTGNQIYLERIGEFAELPDPEPEEVEQS